MAAYLIVSLKLGDLGWVKDYRAHVPDMVRRYGGEYLARSTAVERIEGEGGTPDQVAILTFPSLDAIRALMDSPEYAPFRNARMATTTSDILAFEA